MKVRQYTTEARYFYQNTVVPSNCNSITFLNLGTNVATVDGIPLSTNQSIAFTGNEGEINIRDYNISFSGAGTNSLVAIRKIYVGAIEKEMYAQGRRLKTDIDKNCER